MLPPVPSIDNAAVFLDFDGTLVDFAPTPDAVCVPSELKFLLRQLSSALDGALALITGRSLESLDQLLGEESLCAAGCHGAEWRAHGIYGAVGDAAPLRHARMMLAKFAAEHELLLEDKPYSLALHFRHKPHVETLLDTWLDSMLPEFDDLRVIKGKAIREVQLVGVHKGVAVERFMQQKPFAGRTPIYLGDDVTDEDALAWVNTAGGVSIKVGSGQTVAAYHLQDFCEVFEWLQKMVAAHSTASARTR